MIFTHVDTKRRWPVLSTMLLTIPIFLVGCARTGNNEQAHFYRLGNRYVVEMTGTRRLMAHDPISAIRGRTYQETLRIELPRIEGSIDGAEITPPPDRLSYIGTVVITNGKMKVDLRYDDSTRHPLPWNGTYTLVQRDQPATP